MTGRGPIRVLLANDVELVLKGLEALLAPYADRVKVVGTALGDPDPTIDALTASQTDVLLLDSFSRSGAGIDAAAKVLAEDPPFKVVIFTENDDLNHLFAALRSGVCGYLLKTIAAEDLVDALERVAAGARVVDPELGTEAAILAARTTARLDWQGAHLGLSRREAEVLRLLAAGNGIDATASALGVGRETIRTHVRQIYRKLGVRDRASAVAVAWREGLGS
jgi:DNA-binding NarL/FixJ family response regulator